MSRKWVIGLVTGVVVLGACALVPVVFLIALMGATAAGGCLPPEELAAYEGDAVSGLTPLQMQRAAAVVAEGRRSGFADRGIVIALAVASQESGFKVYANDGQGSDLAADQRGIERSLQYPHDAVGTDHGSLGVFQQQYPWWGTMEELMDPTIAARKFFDALRKVPAWQLMEVTVAAQTVQRSAYPDAYADDQALAEQLLAAITAGTGDEPTEEPTDFEFGDDRLAQVVGTPDCAVAVAAAGTVVFPVPADSGYIDQHNYGRSGSNWESYHTGTDFSVACATPVLAAHSGKVVVRTDQAWSGRWLVQIQLAAGGLTTWYAHMEQLLVDDGETVTAGQQIGAVGTEGNSTGCHLHFEVHPSGGGFAEDDVDPSLWLANNAGRNPASTSVDQPATGTDALSVLTYNIHMGTGGLEKLAQEIAASGAAVVALQEADNRAQGPSQQHIDWLARRLGMQAAYSSNGMWRGKPMIDNAILSKYPIVKASNTRLPRTADIHPRGLLHAEISLPGGGLVDVYATHLHFAGQVRLTQARAVQAEIGSPSCATVLMGDLNFTPDQPMYPVIAKSLRDTFAGGRFGPGRTVPVGTPKARIDYVFHDARTEATAAQVMPAGVSDHRAVRATLNFDPKDYC